MLFFEGTVAVWPLKLNVIQIMGNDRAVRGLADPILALCGGAVKESQRGSQTDGQHAVQVTMWAQ